MANSSFYGESLLDLKQKFIKFSLFGTVVNTSTEDTVYNPLVIEFAAMNLALNLIPAGADYWTSKLISVTATGTNESKTYPDRIATLWQVYARLQQEIKDLLPQVQEFLPVAGLKRVSSVARTTGVGMEWKSTNPQLFPVAERLALGTSATSWTQNLPWSEWS